MDRTGHLAQVELQIHVDQEFVQAFNAIVGVGQAIESGRPVVEVKGFQRHGHRLVDRGNEKTGILTVELAKGDPTGHGGEIHTIDLAGAFLVFVADVGE